MMNNYKRFLIAFIAPVALLSIFIGMSMVLFTPLPDQIAHAATTQVNASFNGGLYYFWDRWASDSTIACDVDGCGYTCHGTNGGAYCGWALGATNPIATLSYAVHAYRTDTGDEVFNGDSLPLGTEVMFTRSTSTTDVAWNAGGYSMDSPYGSVTAGSTGFPFGPSYSYSGAGDQNVSAGFVPPASGYSPVYAGLSHVGNPWGHSASVPAGGWGGSIGTNVYYAPTCTAGSGGFMGNTTQSYQVGIPPNTHTESATFGDYGFVEVADPNNGNIGDILVNPLGVIGVQIKEWNSYYFWNPYNLPVYQSSVATSPDSPTTISYNIQIPRTTGVMYYEYSDARDLPPYGPGCYDSSYQMKSFPNLDASPYKAVGYFAAGTFGITSPGEISNHSGVGTSSSATTTGNLGLTYSPTNIPFQFPSSTISFTFKYGTSTPPTKPVITGTTNAITYDYYRSNDPLVQSLGPSQYKYYGSTCRSPEDYGIAYGFDWNNDGSVDEWSPNIGSGNFTFATGTSRIDKGGYYYYWNSYKIYTSPFLPSGSTGTSSFHYWTTAGDYTVGIVCANTFGSRTWGDPIVVHVKDSPPAVTLAFQGGNGKNDSSTSSPQTYAIGGSTQPRISAQYVHATSCIESGADDWSDHITVPSWSASGSGSAGNNLTIDTPGTYTYTLTCTGPGGTASSSIVVNAFNSPPVVNLYLDGYTPSQSYFDGSVDSHPGNDDYISYDTLSANSCTAGSDPDNDVWVNGSDKNPDDTDYGSDFWYGYNIPLYYNVNPHEHALPVGRHTFSLTCTNNYGTTTSSIDLDLVKVPPVVTSCGSNNYDPRAPWDNYDWQPARVGDSVGWSAAVTGGAFPYTYYWNANDQDINGNQIDTISYPDSDPTLDGSTSVNPFVTYTSPGNKAAILSITDSEGITSAPVDCGATNIPAALPTLTVDGPTEGRVGEPITFSATGVGKDMSFNYLFYWTSGTKAEQGLWNDYVPLGDNGNGYTEQVYVPSGTPVTDTNTWNTPGIYTFYVYATDVQTGGQTDPVAYTIEIKADTCTGVPDNNSTNVADWIMPDQGDGTTYSWSDDRGLLSGTDRFAGPQQYPNGTTTATVAVTKSGSTTYSSCSVHIPFTYHNNIPTDLLAKVNNGNYKSGTIPAVVGNSVTLLASTTAKYCIASGNDSVWAVLGSSVATNTPYAMNYPGGLQQPSKKYILQCGNSSIDDITNGIGDISTSIINLIITITKEI